MIIILNMPFYYYEWATKYIVNQILSLNSFMFNNKAYQFDVIDNHIKLNNANFSEIDSKTFINCYDKIINNSITLRNALISAPPFNDISELEYPRIKLYESKYQSITSVKYNTKLYDSIQNEYLNLVINKLKKLNTKIKVIICKTCCSKFIEKLSKLVHEKIQVYNLCLNPENTFTLNLTDTDFSIEDLGEDEYVCNAHCFKYCYKSKVGLTNTIELANTGYPTFKLDYDSKFKVLGKEIKIPKFIKDHELSEIQIKLIRDLYSDCYRQLGY